MLVHGQYAKVRSTVLAALLIRDWLAAEEKARKQEAAPPADRRSRRNGSGARRGRILDTARGALRRAGRRPWPGRRSH